MEDVTKATKSMDIDKKQKGKVVMATGTTDLTVNEETKLEKKMMKFCSLQKSREFDWSTVAAKTFKRNPKTYFVICGKCVCVCACMRACVRVCGCWLDSVCITDSVLD